MKKLISIFLLMVFMGCGVSHFIPNIEMESDSDVAEKIKAKKAKKSERNKKPPTSEK